MPAFRMFLVAVIATMVVYTAFVGFSHGWNLFPIFFGAIAEMSWQGQFNLDFAFMLMLSGLWIAWRHRFSGAGLAFGALATVGGAPFLATYLLVTSIQSAGNMTILLLGPSRVAADRG